MEIWKKIEEIPDMEVSNYGRFRSTDRVIEKIRNGKLVKVKLKGKIRKTSTDNNGYQKICVNRNGVMRAYVAHRLVAKYFLEDFDQELEVDHIDDNRSNNNAINLRMVTRLQNVRKPSTLEKIRNYLKNLTPDEKIRRLKKGRETLKQNGGKLGRKKKKVVKIGDNSIEFIDDIYLLDGFNRVCIGKACRGQSSCENPHSYNGFIWYYLEDYEKMLAEQHC